MSQGPSSPPGSHPRRCGSLPGACCSCTCSGTRPRSPAPPPLQPRGQRRGGCFPPAALPPVQPGPFCGNPALLALLLPPQLLESARPDASGCSGQTGAVPEEAGTQWSLANRIKCRMRVRKGELSVLRLGTCNTGWMAGKDLCPGDAAQVYRCPVPAGIQGRVGWGPWAA